MKNKPWIALNIYSELIVWTENVIVCHMRPCLSFIRSFHFVALRQFSVCVCVWVRHHIYQQTSQQLTHKQKMALKLHAYTS